MAWAEKKATGRGHICKRPPVLQVGVSTVTPLYCHSGLENKKAQLVMIVHDMDPIELGVFLPTLFPKMGIPYCITMGGPRQYTTVAFM